MLTNLSIQLTNGIFTFNTLCMGMHTMAFNMADAMRGKLSSVCSWIYIRTFCGCVTHLKHHIVHTFNIKES